MLMLAMAAMMILSFSGFFAISIAGVSVFIGVIAFFVNKDDGLDIGALGAQLKQRQIWFWLALPTIMDGVAIAISKLVAPDFVSYVLTRAGGFVSLNARLLLLLQLAVLALGEEIAWRAFFQQQLCKKYAALPAVLISSVLFAIGHWTPMPGVSAALIGYSVFWVFINSVLYGVIFHKTNNAWLSWLAHFGANLLSLIFVPLML